MAETVRSTIQKRDAKGTIRHGGEWLALWSDPDSMKTPAELRRDAAERNAALQVEHRLAAAARSLSGDPDMQISFLATVRDGGAAAPAVPSRPCRTPRPMTKKSPRCAAASIPSRW